jgi:type IV pilus assembly protein PilA
MEVGKLYLEEKNHPPPLKKEKFMKTEFKSRFLQHFISKKKNNEGFTLIELLVVIIIIGILSAIALPSFLNQANKARESEAKTNVGSMNRAQQAAYMEKGFFQDDKSFGTLGLGIKTETDNYKFEIVGGGKGSEIVTNQGQPNIKTVRAYIGGVQIGNVQGTGEATTLVALCEAEGAPAIGGPAGTETVTKDPAGPKCPGKYTSLGSTK